MVEVVEGTEGGVCGKVAQGSSTETGSSGVSVTESGSCGVCAVAWGLEPAPALPARHRRPHHLPRRARRAQVLRRLQRPEGRPRRLLQGREGEHARGQRAGERGPRKAPIEEFLDMVQHSRMTKTKEGNVRQT